MLEPTHETIFAKYLEPDGKTKKKIIKSLIFLILFKFQKYPPPFPFTYSLNSLKNSQNIAYINIHLQICGDIFPLLKMLTR